MTPVEAVTITASVIQLFEGCLYGVSVIAVQGLFITEQSVVVVVSHQLPVQLFDELSSRLMVVVLNPLRQPTLTR